MSTPRPPDSVLVRYAELSLKNKNRPRFERQLRSNIANRLEDDHAPRVERFQGGLWITLSRNAPVQEVLDRLATVPGIAWYAAGWEVERDPSTVADVVLERGQPYRENADSFAVRTQRSDKSLELTSMDFNRRIGSRVQEATGLPVDLEAPDWEIHVQLLYSRGHLSFERHTGIGGLPVGTTGRVLCLLSGGLDSPVAAIQTMKRGCQVDFLHFYAYPESHEALDVKMEDLVNRLASFQNQGTLYLAPYHPFDLAVRGVKPRVELVLFRRHTLRVAQRLADRDGQQALVTGESLGQVASQTLENLTTIDQATDMTVLRPLVGRNKNEIIRSARQFGTYDLSIRDYRDCCAIQASHPVTTTRVPPLLELESSHDLREVDRRSCESVETRDFDVGGLQESTRTAPSS